jgi:L-2-hydroxyglutarate oxidase LhgO
MAETFEIGIVGTGVVGLATALVLNERFPDRSMAVLEKDEAIAGQQTGHNSGVIHAGIYYRPDSHKAQLCVAGVRHLISFCEEEGIPFEKCGKLIVATRDEELPRLRDLYQRGTDNGVPGLELIGADRAREIEPHARAVQALYSPATAIVDFRRVALAMAARLQSKGARLFTSARVIAIDRANSVLHVETPGRSFVMRYLINCGGLHADRIARMTGMKPTVQIIPFRGEYYTLRPDADLVRGLIYPVPDPQFPFLGVHFTKRITGEYEAGPNAVLAYAREGYRRRDVRPVELAEMAAFPGFWRMARRYWKTGMYEMYRSLSRSVFLRDLQKLVPDLEAGDLRKGGSGVRAQLVSRDGRLFDDFHILETENTVHVLNAPSPAATASLAIARHIAKIAASTFDL